MFEKRLPEVLADFSPILAVQNGAFRVSASVQPKSVVVIWPWPLSEVFLDFIEHGEVLLSECVEYYEAETPDEQLQDIARVIRRFLLGETRVVKVGSVLQRKELQFSESGMWLPVLGARD